jgi:Zn-dependent M28 family amino/carboxypeptidase
MPPTQTKRRFRIVSRGAVKRLAVLFILILLALTWAWSAMIRMPGASYHGPLPPMTDAQTALESQLRADIQTLAGEIGGRSIFHPKKLAAAAAFLDDSLKAAGYSTRTYSFTVRGTTCPNIEVELTGTTQPSEIVVIGAHYDAYQGAPAADDNASGVAATLAIARAFAGKPAARTLRFVMFVNEEPPSFQTADMGSWVYAKACRARADNIVAMVSLESIAFFSDQPGSQHYPKPFDSLYPDTGDFVGFVGNFSSRALVKTAIASFRSHARFPSEGAALPDSVPGVGWSDHWAFWQEGYTAIMVTDTALFRNPHYHTVGDTPDTLDYPRLARVVDGLQPVIADLAAGPAKR